MTSAQLGSVAANERAATLEERMAAAEARLTALESAAPRPEHIISVPEWMTRDELRDIPDVPMHFRGKR